MTQDELKEHLRLHSLWFSDESEGKRASLTRADLTRANLYGANLTRANLTGADLTRASLTRADLTRANLCGSDLTGANLSGANLTRANLYGANLTRANLYGANLTDTLFDGKAILSFQFQKNTGYYFGINEIRIGCLAHTIDYWLENFKGIGKANGYSELEIEKYDEFIKICAEMYEKEK